MYRVKEKLSRTYFGEMGSFLFFNFFFFLFFSSDFVTQYFEDIFSESPKSFFFTNKFRNCLIFNKMSQKIDLVYLFIKINFIKGQLSGPSFMELGSFLSQILKVFFL